jgi:hypothetical protein
MSRSPLLSCLGLPAVATACLGAALSTGCLDGDNVAVTPGSDDPLTLVAVADTPVTALPPKPALAQLATATSAVRQRFMDAALGADVSDVVGTAIRFALAPSQACPAVERRGDTIYSIADCTDDAGVHYSGRFVAHTWDDDRPMTIRLDRWSVDAPGAKDDVAYEGTVTVSPAGRFDSNLVAWKHGLVARTVGHWQVDGGKVVSDLDSYVLMETYGIAQIGGSWRLMRGERAEGLLILDGAQELDLDFDTPELGCAPISVDGVIAGKRCDLAELAEATVAFGLF